MSELLTQGNLLQVMSQMCASKTPFSERDAANLVYQILLAIRYVHEANMIHRDIKMENIMVEVTL